MSFITLPLLLIRWLPGTGRTLHLLLSGGAALLWAVGLTLLWHGRARYGRLNDIALAPEELDAVPTLSILVPACNEAATIEPAMCSLLALDYPHLEIIAVNDRSTDATGAILDRLAQNHARLRVRHVTTLPPGWLGKNHALHVASEEARGEWLLFTDADVVFAPGALRQAVAYARRRCLDHLVLSPHFITRGFWERLFVNYFSLLFCFHARLWDVSNPRRSAYVGLGAFNLVGNRAYRACGGHRALPMEVIDDGKLGKVLKQGGYRAEMLDGSGLLAIRWMVGLRGAVEGLTKNAFAGFDYSLARTFGVLLVLAYTSLYPVAALVLAPLPARLAGLTALLLMVVGAQAMKRVTDSDGKYGLAYPLAALVLIYIILLSTWRCYRQKGIVWRGTLYPLEELRRGVV